MRCAAAIERGRECESTCSTCRWNFGRDRSRSIPTKTWPTSGAGRRQATSAARSGRAENLLQLVRSRNLELVVPAIERLFVWTPSLEHRRVTKSRSLHVVVLDFADALDSKRLPREV